MRLESLAPPVVAPVRLDRRAIRIRERWLQEGGSPSRLAEFVKTDLRDRYAGGDRPAVAAYLTLCPSLAKIRTECSA